MKSKPQLNYFGSIKLFKNAKIVFPSRDLSTKTKVTYLTPKKSGRAIFDWKPPSKSKLLKIRKESKEESKRHTFKRFSQEIIGDQNGPVIAAISSPTK